MSDEGITGGDVYVIAGRRRSAVNVTQVWRSPHRRLPGMLSATRIVATEFARATKCSPVSTWTRSRSASCGAPADDLGELSAWLYARRRGLSLSKNGAFSAVIRQSYTSPPEVETGPPGKWKAHHQATPA